MRDSGRMPKHSAIAYQYPTSLERECKYPVLRRYEPGHEETQSLHARFIYMPARCGERCHGVCGGGSASPRHVARPVYFPLDWASAQNPRCPLVRNSPCAHHPPSRPRSQAVFRPGTYGVPQPLSPIATKGPEKRLYGAKTATTASTVGAAEPVARPVPAGWPFAATGINRALPGAASC
jgi:hypothetical protein